VRDDGKEKTARVVHETCDCNHTTNGAAVKVAKSANIPQILSHFNDLYGIYEWE